MDTLLSDANSVGRAIAELVSTAIQASGMPLNRLAEETGIPRSTLKRRLAGGSYFDVVELARLADALGVPVGTFLSPFDPGTAPAEVA